MTTGLFFDHVDGPLNVCTDVTLHSRPDGGTTLVVTLHNAGPQDLSAGLKFLYQSGCENCKVGASWAQLVVDGSGDGISGSNLSTFKLITAGNVAAFTVGCQKNQLNNSCVILIQAYVNGSSGSGSYRAGDPLNAEFCISAATAAGVVVSQSKDEYVFNPRFCVCADIAERQKKPHHVRSVERERTDL